MIALAAVFFASWFAPRGRDRSPTIHRFTLAVMLAGAVPMLARHDYWPLAIWTFICINALRRPWPAMQLTKFGIGIALYGVYATVQPLVTPELTTYSLMAMVAAALVMVPVVRWYWEGYGLNQNHVDMLWAMGQAACLALGLMQDSLWWLLPFGILLLPNCMRLGQHTLWYWAGIYTLLGVIYPWVGVAIFACAVPALAYACTKLYKQPFGLDHGRVRIWYILLVGVWWHSSWKDRLFGLGFNSWRVCAEQFNALAAKKAGVQEDKNQVWGHPHNEYVHMLFEHGVVGLLLLIGWLGSLFWRAWLTEPALLIPAVTLCAVAATSYPWTLPYETPREHKQYIDYQPFGSMGMVVTTLLMLCLM